MSLPAGQGTVQYNLLMNLNLIRNYDSFLIRSLINIGLYFNVLEKKQELEKKSSPPKKTA
jgi:hypothetical protein